ncbi:hypothetical protein A5819_003654 [Enterococcus sp. 7E2_DIV0204]|uniref:hypothetical protein n=1 Tax=unclassified Enterococcus TaxID=2608891 RepID=UPI000A33FBA7|nr:MULTISPECIES: hypothetical protein [unclassified Enterococcus]OTN83835.1 hypothetical protein A5819_003654 [Enterococcus sp. 7E2_DIV0204]OTP47523.1 hypothetical protein A5884_003494 [Enterococcus sp. 7D2_DIV0200]
MDNAKKKPSKMKILCLLIGITVFSIFSVAILFTETNPILAKPETSEKKATKQSIDRGSDVSNTKAATVTTTQNYTARALDPVENEEGLKATPKVLTMKQNEAFPDLNSEAGLTKLFSERIIPHPEYGALYEYVNADGTPTNPSSEAIGFQTIYIEITENHNLTSIRVPIPLTVTDIGTSFLLDNQIALQTDNVNGKIVLYPNETANKTPEQLQQLVKTKSNVHSWKVEDGTTIPVEVISTTITVTTVGSYKAEFEITVGIGEEQQKASVQKDVVVFGADLKSPYYFSVSQNGAMSMGTDGASIFSKYQSLNDAKASSSTYEWVKNPAGEPTDPLNKFDTSKSGFHWGYIKMTDKTYTSVSTVISVPIMITQQEQSVIIGSKVGLHFNSLPTISVSDVKGKNNSEIVEILLGKLSPKAWELTTGQLLDTQVTKSSITSSSRWVNEVTITTILGGKPLDYKFNVLVLPDRIFDNSSSTGWNIIPNGGSGGLLANPINGSKAGFPNRGISVSSFSNELGFIIKDNAGKGYVYSGGEGKVQDVPGVDGLPLYGKWHATSGLSTDQRNYEIGQPRYFLRKGDELKQIFYDDKSSILYVYSLSLSRNLNFKVQLDMYNLSQKTKNFSMLEPIDLDYLTDQVPIYALGGNSGFYMQPSSDKRFTIRLKDSRGNWLSDYTKYIAGTFNETGVQSGRNYFGNDFSGNGTESKNYYQGQVIVSGWDTAYQLGAPWKQVLPDESLNTGYEIFAGQELPYMQIKADPEVFNVYSDYVNDFDTSYKLSQIPTTTDHGTVYVTYPTGDEVMMPFFSNSQKEFDSPLTIPRTGLPEKLNEEPGTIKRYDTSLLAINESDGPYKGLPSQDYTVKINAYNLGAKPIPQIIKKGTAFTKKASEVIQDAVILPDHTASYEYEGAMPDTSVTGLTSVMVRMTDTNKPDKTTLIKVPVQVIDGTLPSKGLYIAANDFSSRPEAFQDLAESEVNQLILKKSEAVAWEVATGSSKDVTLSVESKTLPLNPGQGSYKATLKAVRGSETVKKTITIDIQSNQKVNVEFVDETGEALHDKITFDKVIGTTIDLTKETEVQKVLESIQAKNYQLVKKPDNETAIPVISEESTVQYQFKGMLFVQSSPTFLNFGRKTLGIPFIKVEKAKYDKPLIVWDNRKNSGKWDLTATLKKPLTSQEDSSKVLPFAIRYKINETDTVVLEENVTQSVAEKEHKLEGQYNISDEWDKNESGLLLEVPSGEVLQAGGYRATILWQVEQTP